MQAFSHLRAVEPSLAHGAEELFHVAVGRRAAAPPAAEAGRRARRIATGVGDGAETQPARVLEVHRLEVPEWNEEQKLLGEKETLGLYLTGHPIMRYQRELQNITSGRLASLVATGGNGMPARAEGGERQVILAGLVMTMRIRKTARGGKIAFLTLDDHPARIDVRIFSEVFERSQALLGKDKVLVKVNPDGKYVVDVDKTININDCSPSTRVTVQSRNPPPATLSSIVSWPPSVGRVSSPALRLPLPQQCPGAPPGRSGCRWRPLR